MRLETAEKDVDEYFNGVCVKIHHIDVSVKDIAAFLPDRKDPAEIIHNVVELHLQVFQDIAGFHTQLE